VTPSSGAPVPASMRPNDAYFDLLIDTLDGLETSARARFLRRFFHALTHLDITEDQCVSLWEDVLARRSQLSERQDALVSFQSALVEVLAASGKLRLPIVMEYEELRSLQHSAVTDPLTGLYNRRLFDEAFDKELNRARRYAHPLSLVALDLHRFKEVNDKYGHPRGDEVLRATATTFRKSLRTADSAFRIGGDEFALLLPQTDAAQAAALSRRIGVVFAETLRPLGLTISVSMDHGVATYPQDSDQREPLIRVADERLYRFKHSSHQLPDTLSPLAPPASVKLPEVTVGNTDQTSSAGAAEKLPVAEIPPPSPLQASRPVFPSAAEESRLYAVPRKAERVSMSGTDAYAVFADHQGLRARVVDLGFGGVALEFANGDEVPETLFAVLHVPILPPVRVSLKRIWAKQMGEGMVRVGCSFTS